VDTWLAGEHVAAPRRAPALRQLRLRVAKDQQAEAGLQPGPTWAQSHRSEASESRGLCGDGRRAPSIEDTRSSAPVTR
jgi:hypothetical protein